MVNLITIAGIGYIMGNIIRQYYVSCTLKFLTDIPYFMFRFVIRIAPILPYTLKIELNIFSIISISHVRIIVFFILICFMIEI